MFEYLLSTCLLSLQLDEVVIVNEKLTKKTKCTNRIAAHKMIIQYHTRSGYWTEHVFYSF